MEKVINYLTGFFGGWSNGSLITGAEYHLKNNGDLDATLMSLSVNYALADNLTMFVRQDNEDPNADVDDDEDLTLLISCCKFFSNGSGAFPPKERSL